MVLGCFRARCLRWLCLVRTSVAIVGSIVV
jgi:hypothetical protein